MLPGLDSVTNSGQMPISGGHAASETGAMGFNGQFHAGSVNMGGNVPPWLLLGGAALVVLWLTRKR